MAFSCKVPSKKMIENIFQSHLNTKIRISKGVLPFLHLRFVLFLKELASSSDLEAFKQRKCFVSEKEIAKRAPPLLKKYCDVKRTRAAPQPQPDETSDSHATTDSEFVYSL
ncbi:hypothetical protein C7M84_007636 [Penaeus vannamei]|uniref:Uncharacterized protein n=1 Tax=Penaeus vannamei TaxID=6689 RepID=A0A423TBT0_PENVA|nr:uncharacterized protein LOC113808892 [Penaeus vannamei]ROT73896.1 hypothetical protein C7M84_007636 [Penaeus vannamei]